MELSLRDALDIVRRPERRNLTDHAHAGPQEKFESGSSTRSESPLGWAEAAPLRSTEDCVTSPASRGGTEAQPARPRSMK